MSTISKTEEKDWFSEWFNTPYYHILYKDRNDNEAQFFMDNLTHYLNLPEEAQILDLACGKGRHSIYLNSLGFEVTGVDISENSIKIANESANDKLHFHVHDMRENLPHRYDAIFNLFTSFGYFDNEEDNIKTLKAIKNSLTEYGFGVIDFLNADYVIANLVPKEIKIVDGIKFEINRYVENKKIIKEIHFSDQGKNYTFKEKVSALTLNDFEKMMEVCDIYLLDIFGDYKLHKFYKNQSERLIMIFK
ncbi:bifunctional 2-polyprenyl-6-hydroxyphenol methylase/3-demethylubiquinol 3-O-methyltransferase UbiG [Flavobacterium sp.]|jgi:SAM-dependent methyltransferase|uniref:class I SAM-dependent methyltransferase n=1 Tax=Flavobacterium sp. TaxID=239 RepID=UPI0025C6FAF1|nr:class I SAM-dependent methyltransferase [Flavobacterium sp.]